MPTYEISGKDFEKGDIQNGIPNEWEEKLRGKKMINGILKEFAEKFYKDA